MYEHFIFYNTNVGKDVLMKEAKHLNFKPHNIHIVENSK